MNLNFNFKKNRTSYIIIGLALVAVLIWHFKKKNEVQPIIPIPYNPEPVIEHPRMVGPIKLHGFTNPLEHWQDNYVGPTESIRGVGERAGINLGRTFYNSGEFILPEGL